MYRLLFLNIILFFFSCKKNNDKVVSDISGDTSIHCQNQYARGTIKDSIASELLDKAIEENNKGNYFKAVELLEVANKREENNPILINNLAGKYANLKEFNKSYELYDKSLKIDSTKFITYLSLSVAYNKGGEYDESINILEKGITYANSNEYRGYVYYNLANAYYKKEDYNSSYKFIKKSLPLVEEENIKRDILELKEELENYIK